VRRSSGHVVFAFDLGTRVGGDVLGLPVGTFEQGAYADALALDLEDLSLHPLDTVEWQIVNSMQPTAIASVLVGGDVVAEGGRLTRVDAAEVRERVAKATAGWARP
jgi:5-methylthioadenosine/S-adenosylhomocysteine deaminase